MDIPAIGGWLFSLLTGSILLSWLFNSSGGSIIACAIFHSAIDVAFTSPQSDDRLNNYMGLIITLWGIITLIIYKPRHLSFRKRISW